MGTYRLQKPNESGTDYELYREERRLAERARVAAYRLANRDLLNGKTKVNHIKRRYGLTVDEYNNLIENGCEVCGTTENLCVDHCHETLKVRGCLCNRCNVALGFLREDPVIIQQLLNYIEVHK